MMKVQTNLSKKLIFVKIYHVETVQQNTGIIQKTVCNISYVLRNL